MCRIFCEITKASERENISLSFFPCNLGKFANQIYSLTTGFFDWQVGRSDYLTDSNSNALNQQPDSLMEFNCV